MIQVPSELGTQLYTAQGYLLNANMYIGRKGFVWGIAGAECAPVRRDVQRHLLRLMVIVQYGVLVGLLAEANDSASVVDIVTLPPHFYALPKVLEPLRLSVHGATTRGGPTHAPTNHILLTSCILVVQTKHGRNV